MYIFIFINHISFKLSSLIIELFTDIKNVLVLLYPIS